MLNETVSSGNGERVIFASKWKSIFAWSFIYRVSLPYDLCIIFYHTYAYVFALNLQHTVGLCDTVVYSFHDASSNGNIFRVTGHLGIHRSPVNSLHKGQWRGTLMFSLICARINDWVNNHEDGDLRRHRGHYDVNVMCPCKGGFTELKSLYYDRKSIT